MILNKEQLTELSDIAKVAALTAGKIITQYQDKQYTSKTKQTGISPASAIVTEVDINAEKTILEILGPLTKKYDLGVLTEETIDDHSRFEKDYFWCIDPLDGTLAFTRNEPGYSTSIALVSSKGHPIIGVVYNPVTNDLFSAIKDQGAYKNDSAFNLPKLAFKTTLIFDSSYYQHPSYHTHIKFIKHAVSKHSSGLDILSLGGAVMNAISSIEFAPAFYFKLPKRELGGGSLWDFAATSVIQSEAGGVNSDSEGTQLNFNSDGSTFMNHKGIIYASDPNLVDIIFDLQNS